MTKNFPDPHSLRARLFQTGDRRGRGGDWNKTGLRYVPRKSPWNKMERSGTSILFQTNTRFPVFSKNAHEAKNVLSHVYIEVFIIPGYSLEHFQKNSLFRKTKTYYIYLKTLIYKYIFLFRHSRRLHIPIYIPYKLGTPNLYDVKKLQTKFFENVPVAQNALLRGFTREYPFA